MTKPLIIVESPTKAKTIAKFLGSAYVVESSKGHVRDLPKSKLGVDTKDNFEPEYVIPEKATEQIKKLKALVAKTDEVILATDEDREGEAIAWHLTKALDLRKKKHERIVFHEITKEAIKEAMEHPRKLDMNMVNAQQARRILDRLVGYKLSPLIWKKIAFGLSAGRVQSVAVRLIVEREEEIRKFNAEEYWTVDGIFKGTSGPEFEGKLHKIDGKSLDKMEIKTEAQAKTIHDELAGKKFTVTGVEQSEQVKKTYPPFTTSTLQQEGSKKLGYSAKQTMSIAQKLYEGVKVGKEGQIGLITYMRTDSTNLAAGAVTAMRDFIKSEYGEEYLPKAFKVYAKKAKGAQEAHEAIRPSNITRTPDQMAEYLDPQQLRLYTLIWERTMACQMADARLQSTGIDITSGRFEFRATGSVIVFDGFLKVYRTSIQENELPKITEGDSLEAVSITPNQHFTQPPARFTEAGLIKVMEEHGIGRPSTYAPTITTIQTRNYVKKREDKRFEPTDIGELVNKLLVEHFPVIVDINFTAKMEEDLDSIAEGEKEWQPVIADFYFPFEKLIAVKDKEIDKKSLTEEATDLICPESGHPLIKKMGRFGRFLACTGYPECKYTRPMEGDEPLAEPEPTDKVCKNCGSPMVLKTGRFGKFYACSDYPKCKTTEAIIISTGIACPKCGTGEIIEKKSKRGKIFYSCSRYPDCDQAYWNKPLAIDGKPKLCPVCNSLMLYAGKKNIKCSNCDHKEPFLEGDNAEKPVEAEKPIIDQGSAE